MSKCVKKGDCGEKFCQSSKKGGKGHKNPAPAKPANDPTPPAPAKGGDCCPKKNDKCCP